MTATIKEPKGKKHWPKTITAGSASVKIYEVNHASTASGKAYVLAWKTAAGRQIQKFADPDVAIHEGKIKAGKLASGLTEAADMGRSDRDELAAAREIANGTPIIAALKEWARGRQLAGGNILPACEFWAARNGKVQTRIKVRDVIAEYRKAKRAAKKKTPDMHSSTFNQINAALGDHFIDTVSAKQIEAWLSKWDHPVTRNTYRRRLVAIWRWAQGRKYLPHGVRTEAESAETAQEAAPTIGIVNVPTWRALLAHFRAHHIELVPALALAGFCGLRRSEIHAQTWEDISLERKNLRVTQGKRGTPARRMVPLCDAAIEWLMLSSNRKGPVCPLVEYRGKMQPALAVDGIRRIAKEAMEGDLPKFPSVPENFHRHSYISHRVAATGDIPRVSLDAGNSPKEINKHYRELVSEAEGKEWFEVRPSEVAEIVPMGKAANG